MGVMVQRSVGVADVLSFQTEPLMALLVTCDYILIICLSSAHCSYEKLCAKTELLASMNFDYST